MNSYVAACGTSGDPTTRLIAMGTFTREQAWSYLFAFLAWLAGWVIVIVWYGGHEVVTTPAQGVGLVAMFGACAVMVRSAWSLTRSSEAAYVG